MVFYLLLSFMLIYFISYAAAAASAVILGATKRCGFFSDAVRCLFVYLFAFRCIIFCPILNADT